MTWAEPDRSAGRPPHPPSPKSPDSTPPPHLQKKSASFDPSLKFGLNLRLLTSFLDDPEHTHAHTHQSALFLVVNPQLVSMILRTDAVAPPAFLNWGLESKLRLGDSKSEGVLL